MNEKESILRDVIGTSETKQESKVKKYIRLAFTSIVLGLLAFVIVMAAVRKFWGS